MTEIEKIEYAKSYIDKLANGINPLTDQPIPDHELLNHVRISRCLFYVSDVLRQVAENGGIGKPEKKEKKKKQPFHLSAEDRLKIQLSDEAISVSEITRRINELIDTEQMEKLTYRSITQWLTEIGFLNQDYDRRGKRYRRPSSEGEKLGIFTEFRQSERGPYTATLYSLTAQQFIVDHLDAILENSRRVKEASC